MTRHRSGIYQQELPVGWMQPQLSLCQVLKDSYPIRINRSGRKHRPQSIESSRLKNDTIGERKGDRKEKGTGTFTTVAGTARFAPEATEAEGDCRGRKGGRQREEKGTGTFTAVAGTARLPPEQRRLKCDCRTRSLSDSNRPPNCPRLYPAIQQHGMGPWPGLLARTGQPSLHCGQRKRPLRRQQRWQHFQQRGQAPLRQS